MYAGGFDVGRDVVFACPEVGEVGVNRGGENEGAVWRVRGNETRRPADVRTNKLYVKYTSEGTATATTGFEHLPKSVQSCLSCRELKVPTCAQSRMLSR